MSIILFLIIVFGASFLQGVIGFGFALIVVPLGLSLLGKTTIVTSVLIIGITLNLLLILKNKERIDKKMMGFLIIASFIGMIIGVELFKIVPSNILQLFAGLLVIVYSIYSAFFKITLPKSNKLTFIAGLLSGILNSSTGLSGPPIVMLLANQQTNKMVFKKSLSVFFLFMNITTLILYLFNNYLTSQGLTVGLIAVPIVLLAGYLGNKLSGVINMKAFNTITLLIILITGVTNVYTSLDRMQKMTVSKTTL